MRCRLALLPVLLAACLSAGPATPPVATVLVSPGLQPQVAVGADGAVYVVMGQKNRVFMARSADGGKTYGPARAVADVPNLPLGMRRGPRVAAGGAPGSLVVTAIAAPKGPGKDGDLFAWTTADAGATWKQSESPLNSAPAGAREGLHNLASDGKGNVAVVWLDLREEKKNGTEVWINTSTDDGKTWSGDRPVYVAPGGSACQCCHPSVTFGANGAVHVMFRNAVDSHRDFHLSSSADGGKTFSPAAKLGAGSWWLPACPMDGGCLTTAPDGTPATFWRRKNAIYAAAPTGEERELARGDQPAAVVRPDGTYLFFQAGNKLALLRPGAKERVIVDDKGQYPSLALTPAGAIVAVWESDNQVRSLVIDPAK